MKQVDHVNMAQKIPSRKRRSTCGTKFFSQITKISARDMGTIPVLPATDKYNLEGDKNNGKGKQRQL